MNLWSEISAQIKNATGEEIKIGDPKWAWKVLNALETLSQRVANLESRQPEDMGRTV
jgi:hypothetical protein